ncbi:MAG: hypothetical protein ACR2LK_12115 [Solirubrobacteraceae bacterium]
MQAIVLTQTVDEIHAEHAMVAQVPLTLDLRGVTQHSARVVRL